MLATGRTVAWIMVNPSVADGAIGDPTMTKVLRFTALHRLGRVLVANLFAFRAQEIAGLRLAADPIGPDADVHLRAILLEADAVVVAWGASAKLPTRLRGRWRPVVDMIADAGHRPLCLGVAGDGHPLHPLMLPYSSEVRPWASIG